MVLLFFDMDIDNIYLMDCCMFLQSLSDESIDLAIIDPPYNMDKAEWDSFDNFEGYLAFMYQWIDQLLPKLKTTASIYLFNTPYNNSFILQYLAAKGLLFKNWITWYKKDGFSASNKRYVNNQESILFFTVSKQYIFNSDAVRLPYLSTDRMKYAAQNGILKNGKRWFPNENGKLCTDVWEISSERHKTKVNGKTQKMPHPTPKPAELIERIIKASSQPNDLILDLFSGLGTTAMACRALNRHFIGCENNAAYHEIIQARLNHVVAKPN